MPIVRPFRALRYDTKVAGDIRNLVAPPYDIIYDEWRDRLYARNTYNIVRLIKTRDVPEEGEHQDKYSRAAEYISSWIRNGALRCEETPVFYIHSETFEINGETHTRYGFVGLVRLEEFGRGIFPHERTLSGPKIDRLNLVKATRTNLSQVFGIYSDPEQEIQELLRNASSGRPEVSFWDEQEILRKMWILHDPETIHQIQDKMRDRAVIIADGHHRYETGLAYREFMAPERKNADEPFDYISMYFSSVNDPGLIILPTHRKAGDMSSFRLENFLEKLSLDFEIEFPLRKTLPEVLKLMKMDSADSRAFGFYTGGEFGIARLKHTPVPGELDVEILHSGVIEKILGINDEDIAAGKYLQFTQSPEHAIDDVNRRKDQIAFFLNPIRPEEMFPRVLTGKRMPQKSTYFYPKTLSGLVMYRIDRNSLE